MGVELEWDEAKATSNQRKHGVSFNEARTVFADPLGVIFADENTSSPEYREILIGHSSSGRLLLVCFTERPAGVRIISARPATHRERRDYEEGIQR